MVIYLSEELILKPDKKLLYKWYFQYIFVFFIIIILIVALSVPLWFSPGILLFLAFMIGLVLIIGIIGAIIVWPFQKWYFNTFEYRLTVDHIEVRKGLINKTLKYVPYRTITNINTIFGLFDRRFAIGSLIIETAGASGPRLPEERLLGLTDAKAIQDIVLARIHKYKTPYSTATEISTTSEEKPLTQINIDKIQEEIVIIRQILQEYLKKG